MAVVAGITARDMRQILAGCCKAIVTGTAGTHDLRMVYDVHWRKYIRIVAVLADVRRRDVRRGLAGGVGTVMAADAVTRDIDVVKIRRYPGCGRMTVIAIVAAIKMCRVFSGRGDAVMTGAAGAYYLGMIDGNHRREHIGRMAVFADVAGLNMCRAFASGFGAVMAADAVTGYVHVVEIRG